MTNTIERINPVLRGWAGYFKLSQSKRPLEELDGWIRHKLRCAIWRQWKQPSTRARNQMRARYMQLLSGLLPTSCRGLVVTLDYDQSLLAGPPFSVRDEELRQGFAGWQVEQLEAVEVIEESPKFVQAGASSLLERVYQVSR